MRGVLKIKDMLDYLIYGTFGVAIYYAYQKYDELKTFRKEIDANLIEVKDFKHKFYSIMDYVIPEFIVNKLQDLKAFEVRKSDVWVASFPKSGELYLNYQYVSSIFQFLMSTKNENYRNYLGSRARVSH